MNFEMMLCMSGRRRPLGENLPLCYEPSATFFGSAIYIQENYGLRNMSHWKQRRIGSRRPANALLPARHELRSSLAYEAIETLKHRRRPRAGVNRKKQKSSGPAPVVFQNRRYASKFRRCHDLHTEGALPRARPRSEIARSSFAIVLGRGCGSRLRIPAAARAQLLPFWLTLGAPYTFAASHIQVCTSWALSSSVPYSICGSCS